MGVYDSAYYNAMFMVGCTDARGRAWHDRPGFGMADGFDNHYAGYIPLADVESRLFTWSPVESPIFVQTELGMMPVEGRKALTRSDNGALLGIHGEGYLVHDYRAELLHNQAAIIDVTGIANAGLMADGAQAYVQYELSDNVKSADGSVEVRPFILGATSMDGSLATTFKLGFTNVVCDNTFAMFMGEAGKAYRRKHTRNSAFNVADARAALDLLDVTAMDAITAIDRMLNIDVTDAQWSRFVEAHVPLNADSSPRSVSLGETKRASLTGLYRTDIRVAPWAGTAWGVVQAVNTYNEHMAIVRNVDRYERKMSRAVEGKVATDTAGTVKTLSAVLGRGDLLSV